MYFDLIQVLIITVFAITLLLIPVYILYNSRTFFEEESVNQYSLGNLGSSSVVCSSSFLDEDNFVESWMIGKIASLTAAGVLPSGLSINDAWVRNAKTSTWDGYFDKQKFLADFNRNCVGKPNCQMKGFKGTYIKSGSQEWSDNQSIGFYRFTWKHDNQK